MATHSVQRVSKGTLSSPRVRDDGTLIIDGVAATVGIHEYRRDGKVFREFVPPETLGDPESIDSLARRTVTLEHPVGMKAHPGNYASITVGDMGEKTTLGFDKKSGSLVFKELFVRAARGIKAVIDKIATDVSLVYTVDLDMTPGTWQGKAYDAIQRNRRYNSVAITRESRKGSVAALRLDSAFEVENDGMTEEQHKALLEALEKAISSGGDNKAILADIVKMLSHMATKESGSDAMKAMESEMATMRDEMAKMKEAWDESGKELGEAKAELETEMKGDSENFLKLAAEYNKIVTLAGRVKADSAEIDKCKSLGEIRKLVASKVDNFDNTRADSADYQAAIIDIALAAKPVDTRYGSSESKRTRADSDRYARPTSTFANGRFSLGHSEAK